MFFPNIAAERAKRQMSQDDLANRLGVTRKTLYNWEQKGKIPTSEVLKMAELFDCTADYLLQTGTE